MVSLVRAAGVRFSAPHARLAIRLPSGFLLIDGSGKGQFTKASINLNRLSEEMASLLHTALSKAAVIKFDRQSELRQP